MRYRSIMLIHPNEAASPEPPGGPTEGPSFREETDSSSHSFTHTSRGVSDGFSFSGYDDSPGLPHEFPATAGAAFHEDLPKAAEEPIESSAAGRSSPFEDACGGGLSEAESLLGSLDSVVERLLDSDTWRWSTDDVTEAICTLRDLEARLAAVRSQVLLEAESRGLAKSAGAVDLAQWLAGRMLMPQFEAVKWVTLAQQLFAGPYLATGEALAAAQISEDHARVICAGMEALPEEVPAQVRERAQARLLENAQQLDHVQLKKAAIRLREQLTQVDRSPGGDDPHEDSRTGEHSRSRRNAKNNKDSADAGAGDSDDDGNTSVGSGRQQDPHAARQLNFFDTPEGTTQIRGELDAEGAALLRTALDALSAPAPAKDGRRDPRSPARRRADALVEFVRHALSADVGPAAGGTRPHLSVVIGWDTLLGNGNEPGMTDWGLPLPLEVIRRIACDAQVSRIVLGPDSVPLDVGRTERIVPAHIRRTLVSRDNCCAFPYCDRPSSWCSAHHVRHWVDGGATSLDNLVLLCDQHHSQVHREKWQIVMDEDRRPSFIPPTFIDPQRRPRRNPYSLPIPDLFSATTS